MREGGRKREQESSNMWIDGWFHPWPCGGWGWLGDEGQGSDKKPLPALPSSPLGPLQPCAGPQCAFSTEVLQQPRLAGRSSARVQSRCLPVVSHCRKAKLLPDSCLHQHPSHHLPFHPHTHTLIHALIPTSQQTLHPSPLKYTDTHTIVLSNFSMGLSTCTCTRTHTQTSLPCTPHSLRCQLWPVLGQRVMMSVGKQSLRRIPLSRWQSSSEMNPYQ